VNNNEEMTERSMIADSVHSLLSHKEMDGLLERESTI
jgi:hypothetical protein